MKLIVFDGNSILNRAFYGVKPMTNRNGLFTNAVFGFVNIINKHLSSDEYDCAAIAFDMKAPTFRHKMYDGYKATRKGMPPELAMQLPYAKRFASLFGLKVIEREEYEADDIIGTLAKKADAEGMMTVIVTGDRDSFQLISDNITVMLSSTHEDKLYDVKRIKDEYGVMPLQMIDVKSLMGDSSDNIPGVKGVGEKTALRLIADYGSLDGVYKNLESVKGALHDKLALGRESAYMSIKLARICTDMPKIEPTECLKQPPQAARLIEMFSELEFTSFTKRLGLDKAQALQEEQPEYESADASEILKICEHNEAFVSADADSGWVFICCGGKYMTAPLDDDIAPLFSDIRYKVTVWLYKDLAHLIYASCKCRFVSLCDDVSLMAYVAGPNEGGTSFGRTAESYLGAGQHDEAASLEKLREVLRQQLVKTDCEKLYEDLEKPLARVLFDMEMTGFKVDGRGLELYSRFLASNIEKLETMIHTLSGTDFNINSPKQLGTVLFENLGLPSGRKTKTGYSTDADVLEKLRYISPVVEAVLEYRALTKLRSTYAEGLQNCIAESDGRIHTTFRQTLTMTGRLSSIEPNLQNIPVRTELGRELRRFFLAEDGCVLIDCDYSQIELRVLADMAGDERMIRSFREGDDIHSITASQVFGVPLEDVTPEMRKRAKAVNFGIVYGISDYSLSRDIGVTKKEAERYINNYFDNYPGIRDYLKNTVEQAKQAGYVVTKFGRRRNIPELKSSKKSVVSFGERIARNTPIQGTAADIIKIAMLDTAKALEESNTGAKLILQVHDELIVECPRQHSEAVARLVKEKMENCCSLSVPLKVDAGIGDTWYDSKS